MNERADLHIHSTASDGAQTPAEIVAEAVRAGLAAFSITDHDTIDGLLEAEEAAKDAGIDCVPGVEIGADYGASEVHILGYFIDPERVTLRDALAKLREARLERGAKIVRKLHDLGVPVTIERVLEIAGGGSVGRMHIAQAICETGAVHSMNAAFGKYLTRGAAAFVPRLRMTPEEVVSLVSGAGGVPCLAHPSKIGWDGIIPALQQCGLQGIEVYHTDHSEQVSRHYESVATKYGLIPTGGSDSHGPRLDKPVAVGSVTVQSSIVERLRSAAGRT